MASQFKASQKAIKARETASIAKSIEIQSRSAALDRQQAEVAQAKKQAQELRREMEAAQRRAAKADELAEFYRSGRDQAIDELRALKPQRGHDYQR